MCETQVVCGIANLRTDISPGSENTELSELKARKRGCSSVEQIQDARRLAQNHSEIAGSEILYGFAVKREL